MDFWNKMFSPYVFLFLLDFLFFFNYLEIFKKLFLFQLEDKVRCFFNK